MRPTRTRPLAGSSGHDPARASYWSRIWIPIGAGLFILALVGSAVAVPQLRLLHAFQALIYVAIIFFARKRNVLGFGAGATIAVAWNSIEWLGPHLIQAGAHELWSLVSTGHIRRVDTLMVFVAGIAHVVLLVACVAAFLQLRPKQKDWGKFFAGGLLVLAYFAAIVAVLRPH